MFGIITVIVRQPTIIPVSKKIMPLEPPDIARVLNALHPSSQV